MRLAQHSHAVLVAAELPVEVGQVDGSRGEVRAQAQRRPVFPLCRCRIAFARIVAREQAPRLGAIGIELLSSDELLLGSGEALALGWARDQGSHIRRARTQP